MDDLFAAVREVWRDVLGADDVPDDTPFFEAGGDSRRLVVLYERLKALTGTPIAAADLFEHSTVRSQARLLSGDTGAPVAPGGSGVPAAGEPDAGQDRAAARAALLSLRDDAPGRS